MRRRHRRFRAMWVVYPQTYAVHVMFRPFMVLALALATVWAFSQNRAGLTILLAFMTLAALRSMAR